MAALLVLATASVATADPLDEFGFGARSAALAGAYTASGKGADAAHHNPAGLALADNAEVMLGYGYGNMRLRLSGRDAQVLNVRGSSLGAVIPIRLSDDVVVAPGLALYLPDQFVARIQLIPATEPHFVRLDNDPHRLVLEPVFGVKIGKHLALGGGASILADARSNGITFNVGIVSEEKVGEAALDVTLPPRAAPLVGAMFLTRRVRAGLVYRGELALGLALDILANVDVAGVVTGDALVSIRASNYFTPRKVTGGVAVDVLPDLTITGDVTWEQWSRFPTGLADLKVLVALDVTPPLVQTDQPPAGFEDVVLGRVGVEYRIPGAHTDWAVRGGFAYLPSPVPEQTGITSFADNDRHLLSLGGGATLVDWKPYLTHPVDFSVALQWQHLQRRLTVKDATQFPGQAFASSGNIFHVSGSMTVSF